MIHLRIAPLRRSALFVGVNLALAAFVLLIIVIPLVGSFVDTGERIAEAGEQLARIKALQRTVPLSDAAAAPLPGIDEGSAGAALQSDLKSIAAAAGANFVAVCGLETTRLADTSIVGASIEVTGSVYAIRDVVKRIEDHAPVLIIRSATIRSRSADQDSELAAELAVEGVMQKGQAAQAADAAGARGDAARGDNAREDNGERGR